MNELYGPGPDGNAGESWDEDPRGTDAKDVGAQFVSHGSRHLR